MNTNPRRLSLDCPWFTSLSNTGQTGYLSWQRGSSIAQFGIGILAFSQFAIGAFALAQFGAAYSLIAQIGIYINEGHGQIVKSLAEIIKWLQP